MPAPIQILRDPRESIAKCSLTPLRTHPQLRFHHYHPERRIQAPGHILLHPEGELLSAADGGRPLLLLDCAWRRVDSLLRTVEGELHPRRLPLLRTAYPRKSKLFQDPACGLASVEALYAAALLLGEAHPEFLVGYRWARQFLDANPQLLRTTAPEQAPQSGS